ncbi:MAG: hypothetical protein ACFFE4_06175 [Candidatus Thorarchaeota archaeon]
MNQLIYEKDDPFKLEELHIILIKNARKESEQAEKAIKQRHDLHSLLNPRYYENGISFEDARIKLDATNPINQRNHQGFIRIF